MLFRSFDGAESVKIFGEQIDVKAQIALLNGISGHADRKGLLQWLSGFQKKPSLVFVNHGDDITCTEFAKTISDTFQLPASAPYAGSEYDLLKGEWIRLTDPIYRKKEKTEKSDSSARKRKESAYEELREVVHLLDQYTEGLSGHSNHELKVLTNRIRALMTDQD